MARIHRVALMGKTAKLTEILRKNPKLAEAKTLFFGTTPLMRATDPGVVEVLLEKGADPNIQQRRTGWTALHVAADEGNASVTKLLLERGADPNIRDAEGGTPLSLAAKNGHEDVVSLLLDSGADTRIKTGRDFGGGTALHFAVFGTTLLLHVCSLTQDPMSIPSQVEVIPRCTWPRTWAART